MRNWELGAHAELGRKPWSAVRSGNWKYLQSNTGEEFLFNLDTDPFERNDLSGREPERFQRLRERRDALSKAYRER